MWQVKFPKDACLTWPTEEVEVHRAWPPAGLLRPVPSIFSFDQMELRHHFSWFEIDAQPDNLIKKARLIHLAPRVAPIAGTLDDRNAGNGLEGLSDAIEGLVYRTSISPQADPRKFAWHRIFH